MKHIQFHLIWIWIYIGLKRDITPFNYHSIEFAVWRKKNLTNEQINQITSTMDCESK